MHEHDPKHDHLTIRDSDGDSVTFEPSDDAPDVRAYLSASEPGVLMTAADLRALAEWATRLGVEAELEPEPAPRFAIGDEVVVVGPSVWTNGVPSGYPKAVGTPCTVVGLYPKDGDVSIANSGFRTVIAESSLLHADEVDALTFAVGDYVRITEDGDTPFRRGNPDEPIRPLLAAAVGDVLVVDATDSFFSTAGDPVIHLSDGTYVRPCQIEHVEDVETGDPTVETFAVGDRVLISKTATTCKGGYVSPTVKGRYGTVVDLLTSYNNGEVLVEAEKTDGRTLGQAIDPADLTKVEPEPEPLKVGDRVVRTGPHLTSLGTDYGDRECAVGWGGVVTEDDEDGDFSVRWDLSGRVSSITASSLRKVVDQ